MAAGDSRSPASGGTPGPQTGRPKTSGQRPAEPVASASFYALLQLAEDASLEELRQAFRRQSKRLHPDTTSLPAAIAQDSFRQLRHAYVTLLDPERRRAYDASLTATRALTGLGLSSSPAAWAAPLTGAARAGGSGGAESRPSQGGRGGVPNSATEVPVAASPPGGASRQGHGSHGNNLQGNNLQGKSALGARDGLPKPDSVRRTLSGGEWFALLLLGLALVFCLVLGVGLAWLRGTELVRQPRWGPDQESLAPSQPALVAPRRPQPSLSAPPPPPPSPPAAAQTGAFPGVALADALLAAGPDAALQPSAHGD